MQPDHTLKTTDVDGSIKDEDDYRERKDLL